MRAAIWDGSRLRIAEDAPEPTCGDDDAVVQVRRAGICSTDLEILAGYLGFRGIPGHEFVGEVVRGPDRLLGKRVAGEINFACGRCPTCAAGRRRHCPTRRVLGIVGADGAFAERVRLPVENLHVVPEGLSDAVLVFVEPLAAAFQAAEQTRALAGGRSLVVGAGKLGLLVAQVLALRGDTVCVVARRASAIRVAAKLALEAVDPASTGTGWDLVVEATGSHEGLALATHSVRPLGMLVLKSTVAGRYDVDLAPLVINEITLVGSRCGSFAPALEALGRSEVSVEPLIDETFPLRETQAAFRRAAEPGALKILLDPSL